MGFFQNLFGPKSAPAPKPSARERPQVVRGTAPRQTQNVTTSNASYFEALRDSQDRTPLPIGIFNFQRLLRAFNREKLSFLGRYLYDNNGRVSYAIDTTANYSAPIVWQSASPNPDWNKMADDLCNEWSRFADYTGRFNFWKMQRFMCKAADTDGDIGVLPTSENGIFQLQLIDGWRIRNRAAEVKNYNEGVQVDAKGRVTGYWIDQPNGAILIPANEFFLFGDSARYSEYRACSPLRRGSNDIRDVGDIKAFEKIATKIGSALSAVIERPDGIEEEDVWGNDTGDENGESPGNQPPDDATQQEKKFSIAELLGGDIPIIQNGKLHQLENKRPGSGVVDFMCYLVGEFVCGLGMPPAFYLDEKLTGPNQRSVNGKAQRHFNNRQCDLAEFVYWVRNRVISDAVTRGTLPSQDGWYMMEWNGPASITIDAGREMSQEREDVFSGLMSRQNHYSNRALDWKRETDQSLAEDDYIIGKCKELSAKTGVPLDALLMRYGFGQKAQPQQKDDGQDDKKRGSDNKKPKPKEDEDE